MTRERSVPRTCEYCGEVFRTHASEVKRGNGKFCSRRCSAKHQVATKPRTPQQLAQAKKALARPYERRVAEIAATTKRRCLACAADFPSTGIGNRICDDCKSSEAWQSSGVTCGVVL